MKLPRVRFRLDLGCSVVACGLAWAAPHGLAADTAAASQPAALVSHPTRALLLDLATAGNALFAVGAHGVIVTSADAGATWTQVNAPSSEMLTCIAFGDSRHGWAAGHGGVILTTSDGGGSWIQVEAGTSVDDSFLDLLAQPDGTVFAVGAYGLFLRSPDRGATWERLEPLEEDMHLNRISAGRSGDLLLAGEAGTLALSSDAGATWDRLEPPYDGSFFGLHELGSGRFLAHGLRGHVLVSEDRGKTWTQSSIDHRGLLATAAELPSGAIVVSGAGGALFLSRDGGTSFGPGEPTGLSATSEILAAGDSLVCAGDTGVVVLPLPPQT